MSKQSFFALTLSLLLFCGCFSLPASAGAVPPSLAPSGILVLSDGSLLLSDVFQKAVWLYQPKDQSYTRLAGHLGASDAQGTPAGGYLDGKAESAAFQMPWAISPYLDGYAISDTENHVLRYLENGKVSTIAGSGKAGLTNALGTGASFQRPTGLVTLDDGSLLVGDTDNHQIRQVSTKGQVTTYAGSSEGCADGSLQDAKFREPTGLFYQNGVLYIADTGNHRICKVENGTVTTLAGSTDGTEGFINGKAENARFSSPQGICSDGTSVYVADTGNSAIRLIADGRVSTLLKSAESKTKDSPVEPRALALSGNTLYIGDLFHKNLFSFPLKKVGVSYQDVKQGDWFFSAVGQASALGLMNGTGNNLFSPYDTVSRAMSVTVLSRLEESIHPNLVIGGLSRFADIDASSYSFAPASWAKDMGIVNGDGIGFLPNAPITRADWATILYRYAKASGLSLSESADLSVFHDRDQIPAYAADAFAWAYHQGILTGKGEGKLDPTGYLSRAELALMSQRYLFLI